MPLVFAVHAAQVESQSSHSLFVVLPNLLVGHVLSQVVPFRKLPVVQALQEVLFPAVQAEHFRSHCVQELFVSFLNFPTGQVVSQVVPSR